MGKGRVKQLQSCSKAINMAVIITSKRVFDKIITEEEAGVEMKIRFDEARRRYGIYHFVEVAPFIIKKSMESPNLPLTQTQIVTPPEKHLKPYKTEVKVRVPLLYKHLEEYLKDLPKV